MEVRANRASARSAAKGTILVLGGDGFCGWPTSLHLSAVGYDVAIVDNLSRRKIDVELGTESLTPIRTPQVRLATWANMSGAAIRFHNLTLGSDYTELVELLRNERPKAIVHFAEQRAAPYSMKSPREMRYTVRNNLNGTHDLLCAVVDAGCHHTHIVHLGTMGVYGYGTAGVRVLSWCRYLRQFGGFAKVDRLVVTPPNSPGRFRYHRPRRASCRPTPSVVFADCNSRATGRSRPAPRRRSRTRSGTRIRI
jgi:nucleoside-diphosphate-sugar epimerase